MTTAIQSDGTLYSVTLVDMQTQKRKEYRLSAEESLIDLIRDAVEHDLSRTFTDDRPRAIIIQTKPQRRH